jgi:hypothetical protein
MRKLITSVVIFVAGFALSAVIGGRNLASLAKGNFSSPAALATPTQNAQPSTSQKWEYRVVTKYISPNQKDIDFELNRLGEQGYELCEMTQSSSDMGVTLLTIVFRRPRQ